MIVSGATGLQWLLWPIIDPAPFILFYPAVILASLYGDGLSAIFLSVLAIQYFFVPPTDSFAITWPAGVVRQVLFIISAIMIRYITKSLSAALLRAEVERKKAQEAESWLSTTLTSIGDAVISTDRDGNVNFMNPIAEALTEWPLAEAKGKPLVEVFHIVNQQTRLSVPNPVEKVLEKGGIVGLANHTVIIGRNGKEAAIEDSAAPIRSSKDGPIQGVVLVFRDITEKYDQKEKLADAFKQLQHSEVRTRSILENALDAVVGMDEQGLITDWNGQAEKIFGYTREEAIGRRMSETIIPHQYREAHERGMRHYLASGEGPVLNQRIEITALRRNGIEFPIELSITPIRTQGIIQFAAFIRDISEQRETQEKILTLTRRNELILNSTKEGIFGLDLNGNTTFVNPAAAELLGWEIKDLIGKPQHALSHHSKADGSPYPQEECPIYAAFRRGEVQTRNDEVFWRKDGSSFPVEYTSSPKREGEAIIGAVVSFRDITDRKAAEDALREAVRARDEFVSICSHELKTPVTSMKLQFQMAARQLQKGDPAVQSRESVERRINIANKQIDRMVNLIEEMLDVSRIATGRLQTKRERLDLCDLAREVIERFADQLAALGVELEFRSKPAHAIILGDRYRLEQVISNLLTNAIKYGSGKPIQISIELDDQVVRLSVKDQGIGIAKENLDRIFDRFERAISASNVSGLGLGLYISRQIVEAHEGRIWAESTLGEGSTFTVELPLVSASHEPS